MQTIKFKPQGKGEKRKAFNTIYIKDVPKAYDDTEKLRGLFDQFGRISSVYPGRSEKGNFYYICFTSEDAENIEYGPKCAEKAYMEMHGRRFPDEEKPIYVAPF